MQQGFKELWTTFILVVSNSSSSMKFDSHHQISLTSKVKCHKLIKLQTVLCNSSICNQCPDSMGLAIRSLWRLRPSALLLDFVGLAMTALFLGFLHGSPSHLDFWMCKVGPLIGIQGILVVLDTICN
jgi:hypothetical protein